METITIPGDLLFDIVGIPYLVAEVSISILNLFFGHKILFIYFRVMFFLFRLLPIGQERKIRVIGRATAMHMEKLKGWSIRYLIFGTFGIVFMVWNFVRTIGTFGI